MNFESIEKVLHEFTFYGIGLIVFFASLLIFSRSKRPKDESQESSEFSQQNKKTIERIAGILIPFAVAVSMFYLENYSLNEPPWKFAPFQIIGIISFTIIGSLIVYSVNNTKNKKTFILFSNTYIILMGVYSIIYGLKVISKEEIVFKAIHFSGKEAVYQGKVSIGFGILAIISPLFIRKIGKELSKSKEYQICSDCLETFPAHTVAHQTCPKCGGKIEELKGFYDRHPELTGK